MFIKVNQGKLDQVYCAWLKKGLLCLYILYWVSKVLVCLYILEKVEIWSGVTDAWHTDSQTTEYRATQLVSSIKFKLSHAILILWCIWKLSKEIKRNVFIRFDIHEHISFSCRSPDLWRMDQVTYCAKVGAIEMLPHLKMGTSGELKEEH